jgi:hypothetical protein
MHYLLDHIQGFSEDPKTLKKQAPQGEKEREEMISASTDLPRRKADVRHLLPLKQNSWQIEKYLHSRRDVIRSGFQRSHFVSVLTKPFRNAPPQAGLASRSRTLLI